jgi:hypothetical protein
LAGLLLPAFEQAIESAYQIECINNQKQLVLGVTSFSNDSNNHLPGNIRDYDNPDPMKRDWLRGENPHTANRDTYEFMCAPENGTLYSYIENKIVYLCPSVTPGEIGENGRGNGMFDYSIPLRFTGAKLNLLPRNARYNLGGGTYINDFFVTIFAEESIDKEINRGSIEGGYGWWDGIVERHSGKITISSADGSARSHNMDVLQMYAADHYQVKSHKGQWYSFAEMQVKYGDWNKR